MTKKNEAENTYGKEQAKGEQTAQGGLANEQAKSKQVNELGSVPENTDGSSKPTQDFTIERVLSEASPEVFDLRRQIAEFKAQKKAIKSEIKKVDSLFKPTKSLDRKLGLSKIDKPESDEKNALIVYKGILNERLVNVNEKIKVLNGKLSTKAKEEKGKLAVEQLKSKAASTAYVRRNFFMIKKKLLGLLNGLLEGDDLIKKASLENVRKMAFKGGEEGIAEFNQAFAELLLNTNEKAFILVSGKLRDRLYSAAKLTLQMWNPREPIISKLVFPEDLQDDIKQAPDPFISNKFLITSLILRFLNRVLREKRQEIISLRELAKTPEDHDSFTQAINEFVNREDEDVYQIGAGGLRVRLNETIRLTLLRWQPELSGGFEEVIIAGNN